MTYKPVFAPAFRVDRVMDQHVSEADTLRRFYEMLVASRAVADQLQLPIVAIKLDGAIVALEMVLAQREADPATPHHGSDLDD